MTSVEEVISELKMLRPEQVEKVARIIHELSQVGCIEARPHCVVPARVVDIAVKHGWPAELFTKLIGSLPDLERFAEPPVESRTIL